MDSPGIGLEARHGMRHGLKGFGVIGIVAIPGDAVEPYGVTKTSALGIVEQRVNVIVDFTEPPERWQSLGHGYRVEVAIVVWRSADVLKIPVGTLFREAGQWAVFTVEDGKAALRRIEIGRMNGREAEVLSGLESGETLIQHPSDRIADGVLVTARPNGGA